MQQHDVIIKLNAQGFILDPIFFLIYINDITRCSNVLKFPLYADDTNLYFQGSNLNSMVDTFNTVHMYYIGSKVTN